MRGKQILWPQWGHGPEAVETAWGVDVDSGEGRPQWGHGPEAVETLALPAQPVARLKPQWGHGPEAVETPRGHRVLDTVELAAMGPRP